MSLELKFVRFLDIDNFPIETQKLLKDYICPLCTGVIYEPQTDICGHLFCKECIQIYKNSSKYCPIYKDKILKIQDIIVVKNIINGKKVNCKNLPYCVWSDKVRVYKNHIENECLFEKIHCDKCKEYIDRKDLKYHLNECVNKNRLEESQEINKLDCLNKCIYQECPIFFNNDISSHLIESKLFHEKIFIKEFYEFKMSIETRFTELETKAKLRKKKKRDNLMEDIKNSDKEEKMSSKQISIEKNLKCHDKFPNNDKKKKVKSKDDLCVIENLPKEKLENEENLNDENKEKKRLGSSKKLESKRKCIKKQYEQKADVNSLMNVIEFSRGIRIYGNTVINKATTVKHRFGFMNYFLNETSLAWMVEIKSIKEWIGLGICLKDEIIVSGYKFEKPLLHSTFLVTSNGYVWNCMNDEENGNEYNFLMLKKGDIVKFNYNKEKSILKANFNGYKIELTNVFSQMLNFLVPCAILLHENDEVEFNLIN